jgi:hypothetical protein
MPTLRLIYLTEQQYADVMEDETNNTTAAVELPATPRILLEQNRFPIDGATRHASSNNKPSAVGGEKMEEQSDDHEEGDDYVDTFLQEAIDEVNRRSFDSHAVRDQQVPHEEIVFSSDEEENEHESSSLLEFEDTVQQFQHEMVSNDEDIDNAVDSSSLRVHLDAIQQKSGNKRKRTGPHQIFDERFNGLIAFKARYGHCDVPFTGDNTSLGKWCTEVRGSYKKIQNNQKPTKLKLSDEQIQRLNDEGFKWSLRTVGAAFNKRFNDLMSFKANYGHSNVSQYGENASLGKWCCKVRGSYKKIQNNQKPQIPLSDEQIQRLNDVGFKLCSLRKREITSIKTFDERFTDLTNFKTKYGHCDVSCTGENSSLGRWCSVMRVSYKKIQNNQKPSNKLSDEQSQRLNDAGFKWCVLKGDITPTKGFDERFNDFMAFKTKYGHCDVSCIGGEDASLGIWCNELRRSYKKIQTNQKPKLKLSDEQIQRLNDAGFKWCCMERMKQRSTMTESTVSTSM